MQSMHLVIQTPEAELFAGAIKSVKLPGTLARFQVLPGHIPLVSTLSAGTVVYVTTQGQETQLPIQQGVVHVQQTCTRLFVQLPD